jgi:dolichyl-phosphate-mannose--protein O-mannosyl transferase
VALVVLAVSWWRARWALHRPEPVILGAAISTYVPWLVLSGDRSQTFLWYFLPTVPFLGLALGVLAAWAWQRMAGRVAVVGYALVILASFAWYVPVLTALPMDPEAWRMRILFADCEHPDGVTQSLPDDSSSQGLPPDGWCWI